MASCMAPLGQVALTALFYFVIQLAKTASQESSSAYYDVVFNSRVACSITLQCAGELSGDNVTLESAWYYYGPLRPVGNESNVLVTTEVFQKAGADSVILFLSNLTFSPLVKEESLHCQSGGSTLISVDKDPIVVLNAIPDVVDISDKRIGDTIALSFDVDTCLTDIRVSFYKGSDLVHSISSVRNRQRYIYKHQVSQNSMGAYSYRVSSRLASTPLLHFTITGSPLPALTD